MIPTPFQAFSPNISVCRFGGTDSSVPASPQHRSMMVLVCRERMDMRRSAEAEEALLLVPVERQLDTLDQGLCGETHWLTTIRDGFHDVGREEGER